MKDKFTEGIIELARRAGPETYANFYEGEGQDKFSHIVIERPDMRDPITLKEMPNPTRTEFDPLIVGLLSGVAVRNSILSHDETIDLADEVSERMVDKLRINILVEPDDFVKDKFQKWTQSRIVEFSRQLGSLNGFPEEFLTEANLKPIEDFDNIDDDETLYIPEGNFGIIVPKNK